MMRPKTEKEKRRLEDILRTLDGLGSVLGSVESKKGRARDRIMRSRLEEFGIEKTEFRDYAKLILPVVFFGAFIIFLIIALTSP
jgi:Cdc6-like AAA superfamily ATPase